MDSDVEAIRRQSEKALEQELGYACHLGVSAILIKLSGLKSTNLARMLYSYILGVSSYQIWIHVPMVAPKVRASFWRSDYEENEKCDGDECTWEWYA